MAELDVNQMDTTDFDSGVPNISIDTATTDRAMDQKETSYINSEWTEQLGLYHNKYAPELKKVIDAKATWTVGKGFIADEDTEFRLNIMQGIGVDTFNTIIENMIRTYQIGGDSFCEVVRRDDGWIINLKPLTPEVMKIVANRKGLIIRYEQIDRKTGKRVGKPYKPEQIFHLCRNRVADEIHGQSMVKTLKWIMEAKSEALEDWRTVLHRNVWPIVVIEVDREDTTTINKVRTEWAKAIKNKDAIVVPKGSVKPELFSVAPNATLNAISWLTYLDDRFYEAAGVPKIIVGGAGGLTEAAVKIAYLAFQQTIEEEQTYIEEQVLIQLGFQIDLVFPASLENELISDNQKDGAVNIDPSETTAGEGQ